MPVRMKDIARELGVSIVTVSKVLRNHSDIGEETRRRVLKRVEELNYRPNFAARALVTGRSQIIGLVVPDVVHPCFTVLSNGLSRVLRARGFNLVISSSEENPELERQEIDHLLARGVDGLIIASAQCSEESLRKIEEQQTPYILINRKFDGLAAHYIGVDDEKLGRLATEHLVAIGRQAAGQAA
jgi:LacI family transcriptional regulator